MIFPNMKSIDIVPSKKLRIYIFRSFLSIYSIIESMYSQCLNNKQKPIMTSTLNLINFTIIIKIIQII